MYEVFEKLLKLNNVTPYRVAKEAKVTQTMLTNWKLGKSTPKGENLQKIADYFGVTVDYLMTGEEKERGERWYINDETAQIAQEIFESKELRMLFDASRDIAPEKLRAYHDMMIALEKAEHNEED